MEQITTQSDLQAYIASKAVVEIHYTIKKLIGESRARSALGSLLCIVDVIDTSKEDFIYALSSDIPDFEDAVTLSAAIRAQTDYIITRDKHYRNRSIPALSAEEFLRAYLTTKSQYLAGNNSEETHLFP